METPKKVIFRHKDIQPTTIDFFLSSNMISKEEAEAVYEYALLVGMEKGTEVFDECIEYICKILKLDAEVLSSKLESLRESPTMVIVGKNDNIIPRTTIPEEEKGLEIKTYRMHPIVENDSYKYKEKYSKHTKNKPFHK